MSSDTYVEHYKKYMHVYENLSKVNGGKTVWIPTDEHDGWYVSSPVTDKDSNAWNNGYPNKSKPSILPDNLSPEVEHTAYTTITYAPDKAYKTKYYKEKKSGYDWMDNDSQRLPNYGEMVAWALYVDIDIKKEYKKRPISEENKNILEKRLDLWVKAFESMTGDIKHVQLLDSGGGVYVFTPPSALSPIADRYDEEDRELIFTEIGSRMRKITGQLNKLICNEDEHPKEIFSADKVQNKNRQFKTIGSIHKSIDAVVHPINPTNIQIQHKTRDDITKNDINIANEWVNEFTDDKHKKCIDNIIEYMFQGQFTKREDVDLEFFEGTTWDDILDNWLEEKKERIEKWELSLNERKDISKEQLHTEITQDESVRREAIRRINNDKLKQYIIEFLGSDNVYKKSGHEMDFYPFWRGDTTQSGRSAFYDFYEGGARFTDKADGTSRDIVYWIALEMTYDDKNYPDVNIIEEPGEKLESGYWDAVQELRNRGEKIPVYVPEPNGDEPLPKWMIRQIGYNLNIIDDEDIIQVDGEDKLIPSAWNKIINKLNDEDIIHNCETDDYVKPKNIDPPKEEYEKQELLTKQKSNLSPNDMFYETQGWLLPEFDSNEEYEEFLDKVPNHLVAFLYEEDIKGPTEGVLLGSVVAQDEKTVTLTAYEFDPISKIDVIKSAEHLGVQGIVELDKTKMTILLKSEEKRN